MNGASDVSHIKSECASLGVRAEVEAFSSEPKGPQLANPEAIYIWRHSIRPDRKFYGKWHSITAAADNVEDLLKGLHVQTCGVRLEEKAQDVFRDCCERAPKLHGEHAPVYLEERPDIIRAYVLSAPEAKVLDRNGDWSNLPMVKTVAEGFGRTAYEALISLRDQLDYQAKNP